MNTAKSNPEHLFLGVHCSVSGGLTNAFDEAGKLGIDCFQIFTKNQRQWKERVIAPEEADAFRQRRKASGMLSIFSHCSYLINLATPDPLLLEKSRLALIGELERCTALGLDFCVLHPGSARGSALPEAIRSVADQLQLALQALPASSVKILLENTAGQGAVIGSRFEELAEIAGRVASDRIAFCFDTCHAFAAGYDIRSRSALEEVLEEWDRIIGLDRLHCLHLNDSRGGLGSHLDRHEHIGHGKIGEQAFAFLMNAFSDIPKVIETPKADDRDRRNLAKLRSFLKTGFSYSK